MAQVLWMLCFKITDYCKWIRCRGFDVSEYFHVGGWICVGVDVCTQNGFQSFNVGSDLLACEKGSSSAGTSGVERSLSAMPCNCSVRPSTVAPKFLNI